MPTDLHLFVAEPKAPPERSKALGRLSIREVTYMGETDRGQPCLTLDVESESLGRGSQDKKLSWLSLNVTIWTSSVPSRPVGQVLIDPDGMLSLSDQHNSARWRWRLLPDDVELVERGRSGQPSATIGFEVELEGIAKAGQSPAHLLAGDIVAVRASRAPLAIPTSQWDQLLRSLGYELPPSQIALAGLPALDHPSWREAAKRLEQARSHHRLGEDYAALRACLSTLEALVSAPYRSSSWQDLGLSQPAQRADAIAELFSGLGTYLNRVGHHRGREQRDADGDLAAMPLEHWEADLVLGATQFLLAYALRLRMSADETPISDD